MSDESKKRYNLSETQERQYKQMMEQNGWRQLVSADGRTKLVWGEDDQLREEDMSDSDLESLSEWEQKSIIEWRALCQIIADNEKDDV